MHGFLSHRTTQLREYFSIFGIPVTTTSDGASVFTSKLMENFFDRWGVVHRVATAYHPRANKRSEVGVKSAKRLVRGNLAQDGSLQNDKFARALLVHRNTPCPISGLSPAQIIFGRVLRDFLPLQPGKFQPRPEWRQAAQDRDFMYAKRHILKGEQLTRGSKTLPPLQQGDCVAIQNQTGNQPRQWSQTGVVIEVGPHDSYTISVDGSRTVTKRNRQYLRKISPFVHSTIPPKKPVTVVPTPSLPIPVPVPVPAETATPDNSEEEIKAPSPIVSSSTEDTVSDDVKESGNNTTKPRKRPLPPHLRERWIVAEKPPRPTEQQEVQGVVTPYHYTNHPTYPVIAPVQTNVPPFYPSLPLQYPLTPFVPQFQTPFMGLSQPAVNPYNTWMDNQFNPMMNY